MVDGAAADKQRFLRQLTENALINQPPLGIVRDFSVSADDAHPHTIDLKVNGATLFVDAARIFALATGVAANSSVVRLAQWSNQGRLGSEEAAAWASAFHFLQSCGCATNMRDSPPAPRSTTWWIPMV